MCSKGMRADWVIYHNHQSDDIKIYNFKDYTETKDKNYHIRCGEKLIEDHECTNLLDFDKYFKKPNLCHCMYVNAGMYEEFNGYLTKYKNEKIKVYNKNIFFLF